MSRKKNSRRGGGHPDIQKPAEIPAYFLRLSKNGHGLSLWIPQSMQKAAGITYGSILSAYVKPGLITLVALDPLDQGFAENWPRGFFNREASEIGKIEIRRGGRK